MANVKTAASQEYLEDLHRKFAEQLMKDLDKDHFVDEDGKEIIPTSLYNVIMQFLKNNNIEKVPKKKAADPIGALAGRVKGFTPDGDPIDDDDSETFESAIPV